MDEPMRTSGGDAAIAGVSSARPVRTPTLLLVDDEENIRAALKRLLRRDGYDILSAGGGQEGLDLMVEHEIDVIVSDQRMPNMTGVEFLRQAKVVQPQTVRIVLSGYTELQSITDAINEGAIYKFLTKPWDDEQLRANIAEAFRHKALDDENRQLGEELQRANAGLAEVNDKLQLLLAEKQRKLSVDEASLDIAREVLLGVPAPIVGVDDDGLIVFANAEADAVFGAGAGLLGAVAAACLPADLAGPLATTGRSSLEWSAGGRRFRAHLCDMGECSPSRGRLLIMMPME